jgi:sodium transport system permease protein
MAVAGWFILGHSTEFGPPPPLAPLWLAIALVPISALYSALCLALAALARSTREGQYYLVPLLLVTMPLAVLPMAPGVELTLGNALIPVTGVVLLLRDMIEGSYWQALQYLPVVLGVTLTACVLAVRWAVDQFSSETVLFRESERLDVGLWLRHLLRDRQPTPAAATAVFCGVLILMLRFFVSGFASQPHDFKAFALQEIVLELAAVAFPALLMAIMLTSSPRQTLLLRLPRWTAIVASLVLVVALHPVVTALQTAVARLYPIAPEVQGPLENLSRVISAAPLWQLLLLLALLPAVCEELAFRGFILSGFRHLGYRWRAIAFSAVFFGLTHGILQQSLLACFVGVVIGVLAVQTGSLLPGVLFHLVHNALPLALSHYSPWIKGNLLQRAPLWIKGNILPYCVSFDPDGGISYRWPLVVGGGLVAALILAWFLRIRAPKSAEEQLREAIQRGSHNVNPEV